MVTSITFSSPRVDPIRVVSALPAADQYRYNVQRLSGGNVFDLDFLSINMTRGGFLATFPVILIGI